MTTTEAVMLAIVEGLTEYLPVSSTGHMILTEAFLKMQKSTFTNLYIINIQFGAILSVLVLYWRRFIQNFDFYFKLFVAFLPAAIIGFLLNDYIDTLLSSVTTVAVSLIVGGVILIWADEYFHSQIVDEEDEVKVYYIDEFGVERSRKELRSMRVSYQQAFTIGLFQCISMIPGISRSAATIIGGLTQKMGIKSSAEFSFFLAVPTIAAASLYKLLKGIDYIKGTDLNYLIMGNIISFIVGVIAIKFFIGLITKYGLRFFGYYRIILGVIILLLMAAGFRLEIID